MSSRRTLIEDHGTIYTVNDPELTSIETTDCRGSLRMIDYDLYYARYSFIQSRSTWMKRPNTWKCCWYPLNYNKDYVDNRISYLVEQIDAYSKYLIEIKGGFNDLNDRLEALESKVATPEELKLATEEELQQVYELFLKLNDKLKKHLGAHWSE